MDQKPKIVVNVWQQGGTDHLMRNTSLCLNQNMHCYSNYQVQGAYAHLNKKMCQDIDEALAAVCAIRYYDDPLHLAVPYLFFIDLLPEPPDGFVKSFLSLALILFVYLYPIFIALIQYWTKLICSSITLSDDKNSFNHQGRRHKQMRQQQQCLHIKVFTSNNNPSEYPFSWDADGIPFIIDNSDTAIISNERKLFTGPLVPAKVTLETAEGVILFVYLYPIFIALIRYWTKLICSCIILSDDKK